MGDESSEAASHFIPPGLPYWSGGKLKCSVTTCSLWWIIPVRKHMISHISASVLHWRFAIATHSYLDILLIISWVFAESLESRTRVCVCIHLLAHAGSDVCSEPVKQQFPYPFNCQRSEAFRQPAVGWWQLAEHASDSIWAGFSFKASHLPVS